MRSHRAIIPLSALALTLAFAALAADAAAAVRVFRIRPGDGQQVEFESQAPMETFQGRTDQASGRIEVDLDRLTGPITVRVAVDLASLDTGLGLRNTHMRENHLETETYPEAVFEGHTVVSADPPQLGPGATAAVEIAGTFTLHGVAHERMIAARVTRNPDESLSVACTFAVSLAEHEIDRPKFLMLKLADEQQVRLDLTARLATGEETP